LKGKAVNALRCFLDQLKSHKIFVMKKAVVLSLLCFPIHAAFAQVEVDRPVTLTGAADSDRAVKNLAMPEDDYDAANKKYVDDQITASSGGAAHMIGEQFGGGVVYEVFRDINGTEHGLVVDLHNQNNSRSWSGTTNATVPGAGAQSIWNGLANSAAIAAQNGNSAAAECLNSAAGGFDDWFLPSIAQLRLLWTNMYVVSRSLADAGGTALGGRYWSSSEESSSYARFLNLSTNIGNAHYGDIYPIEKSQLYIVRCVRIY
jgi:hypothetical protein